MRLGRGDDSRYGKLAGGSEGLFAWRAWAYAGLLLLGSCAQARPEPYEAAQKSISSQATMAITLIEQLPPWNTHRYTADDVRLLNETARRLAALPGERVREAIEFMGAPELFPGNLETFSKLYLVLRALYRVSDDYPAAQTKGFGGWMIPRGGNRRPPGPDGDHISLLWPLKEKDGVIVEVTPFLGYVGAPYDALGEYDYFRQRFPLRWPSTPTRP
jgi:hypothetical protein